MSTWLDLKNNHRLKHIYDTRIKIIKLIRDFFYSQDFFETDTPIAVRYAGQEPHLSPVPVDFYDPNGRREKFFLHTSPEYAMKKLLAAGYGKIFQITKCFRNYESFGGLHNIEFTMLEWYRAPGGYKEIGEDAEKLFKYIAKSLSVEHLIYHGKKYKIEDKWEKMSMKEVWRKYIGVNLDEYLSVEPLKDLARMRGYDVEKNSLYEDLFFKIFLNEIEPKLGAEKPLFVFDYPAPMASLSRLCAYDARYAERFELYVGGLELANAFGELTDAGEQLRRLEEDKNQRVQMGKEACPVDLDFIEALKLMPTAGGIALGVDRMVLLFTGARDIDEAIFGSVKDQIE